MQIGDQAFPFSATNLEGGGKLPVGITATAVTFSIRTKTIIITADADNSGLLYIGNSNVTSNGNNSITYLSAGDLISIDYNDSINKLYVVGSTTGQYFWKGALQ